MRCSTQILCAFCAPFPCSGRAGLGAEAECDKALCWEGEQSPGQGQGALDGLGLFWEGSSDCPSNPAAGLCPQGCPGIKQQWLPGSCPWHGVSPWVPSCSSQGAPECPSTAQLCASCSGLLSSAFGCSCRVKTCSPSPVSSFLLIQAPSGQANGFASVELGKELVWDCRE